ncbi:MAG: hypothetical protein HYY06_11040 [Deltaproteobacteria bacterium]|nr:hypothetical protein [Deltaproteobacteria bacterium]
MSRWTALLALLTVACPGGEERDPPVFTALSASLLTFEGAASSVIVQTDRRARFSVMDPEDMPRGAAVAQNAGRLEIPFDASGLPAEGGLLRVVGVSDSGGRAQRTVSVKNGFAAVVVMDQPILDAALLTDGRLAVVAAGEGAGLFLQLDEGDGEFSPLETSGTPLSIAAGEDGDFFVGGEDDVIVHYDDRGEECDRVTLIETMTSSQTLERPFDIVDMDSRFGDGMIELVAAHKLGFSGFNFSDLDCNDGCGSNSECTLDPAHGFSTGTCLTLNAPSDFGATAVALDAPLEDDPPLVYSGGYTFNVWETVQGPNMCVDLGAGTAALHSLADIVIAGTRIWVGIGTGSDAAPDAGVSGIYSLTRGFNDRDNPATPPRERYSDLPDADLRCLGAAVSSDGQDSLWFGTASGVGRLRVDADGAAEVDWISGDSLPGRSASVVIQPPASPSDLWVGTDGGLARLVLP